MVGCPARSGRGRIRLWRRMCITQVNLPPTYSIYWIDVYSGFPNDASRTCNSYLDHTRYSPRCWCFASDAKKSFRSLLWIRPFATVPDNWLRLGEVTVWALKAILRGETGSKSEAVGKMPKSCQKTSLGSSHHLRKECDRHWRVPNHQTAPRVTSYLLRKNSNLAFTSCA